MLCNALFYSTLFSRLGKTRQEVTDIFIKMIYTVDAFVRRQISIRPRYK